MNIYILFFIIFMVGMLLLGIYAGKNNKGTTDDYYSTGRSMGTIVVAGTYGASFMSATAFIGQAGQFYAYGWSSTWQYLGTIAALFMVGLFFATKMWRFGYYNNAFTLPDVFALRYSKKWSRALFAIIIATMYLFGLASMYLGFYSILGSVTGLSFIPCIMIGAGVMIVFTMIGGQRGVAWTDTAQFIIMVSAVLIALPTILYISGGFEELNNLFAMSPAGPEGVDWAYGSALLEPFSDYYTLPWAICFMLIWCVGNPSQPHQITRVYLAKNEKVARRAVAVVIAACCIVYIATFVIGAYARTVNPALESIDMAYATAVLDVFPKPIAAFVLIGVISAIVSTASTQLLISSQSIIYDIYKSLLKPSCPDKKVVKLSKITIIIFGIASILVAFLSREVQGITLIMSFSFAVLAAGAFPSLIAAFYWPRATKQGNIASMIIGVALAILLYIFPELRPFDIHPVAPSLIISAVTLVVVSLCTPKPPKEVLDIFYNDKMRGKKSKI